MRLCPVTLSICRTLAPSQKFFLLMVLLATVSEVVQLWFPSRSFNIMDWLSNMTGLGLGRGLLVTMGKVTGDW
ncbi:MAG: VanZ family protein [Bacteroidales bacterium]|nr:VanZ family protein [Bacteroidales bacterium]